MAVRNEVVRLELDDQFTSGMARAAAATALLNRRLTTLNTRLNTVGSNRNRGDGLFGPLVTGLNQVPASTRRADQGINQLTGRLRLLAQVAATIGPALVPIGAAGIQAVSGLANQLGAAALAGGVAITAFQGVGDALEAVNKAAVAPTADSLREARILLRDLSPAAADFVLRLQELRPAMTGLRDVAAEGLFPGVQEALDDFETRLPAVEAIFDAIARSTGTLVADMGDSLASNQFDDFFNFLATEVPETLDSLGRTVGNLAAGMAELWMAFDPLNDDFSRGLLEASRGFNEWADGLAQTQGFQDFIDYVRENGPRVVDALASIGNAAVQIVTAVAPLGESSLMGITAFSDAIAAIAASDFGTPIAAAAAAISALNLAIGAYAAVAGSALVGTAGQALIAFFGTGFVGAMAAAAAAVTALQVALAGAVGVGAVLVADQFDDVTLSAQQMDEALRSLAVGEVSNELANLGTGIDSLGSALSSAAFGDLSDLGVSFLSTKDEVEALDAALGELATTSPGQAARAFETIRAEAERAGLSFDELLDLFPQFQAAMGDSSRWVPGTFMGGFIDGLQGSLLPGLRAAQGELDDTAQAAERFGHALARLNGFLDRRAAFRNYQGALDDFKKSVRDNGKVFDEFTRKGRENKQALDDIARGAIQVAEHMRGTNRARFMTQAAKDIRQVAQDLNLPREATQRVIDKLREAGNVHAKPKITADNKQAMAAGKAVTDILGVIGRAHPSSTLDADAGPALGAMAGVRAGLNALDGDVATVTIRTVRETVNKVVNDISTGFGVFGKASGGYISGPGTATSDSIPAWLSNGEYVIRASAVEKYGKHFFDRINAQAYASGGMVRPNPQTMQVRFSDVNMSSSVDLGSGMAVTMRGIARAEIAAAEQDRNRRARAGART